MIRSALCTVIERVAVIAVVALVTLAIVPVTLIEKRP